MPDVPNPMNPYGGRDDENDGARDGLEDMLRNLMGGNADPGMLDALRQMGLGNMDPAQLGMVQAQFQAMMSGDPGSSFNERMAADVARRVVSAEGDSSLPTSTHNDVAQVAQVANLWLDAVTDFAAPAARAQALSRSEWIEATMSTWRKVVEPVATGVGNAISDAMMKQLGQMDAGDLSQLGIPEGMLPAGFDITSLSSQMTPMLKQMSSSMFGMQVGQAIGALAGESVTGTEVGLPLISPNAVTVLPANVAKFADGLGVDAGEVHLYLAVREAARVRLYERVPWLGAALIAAVQSYAGDIRIDTDAIEEKVRDIDPSDAEAMQQALAGNLFSPEPSAEQKRALAHLETLLALVEGWVDVVTDEAVSAHLPNAAALSEAVRRRRASAGPAEKAFSSLVGLDLRPRQFREAATLWRKLQDASDSPTRDAAWSHPDFIPTAEDIADPDPYVATRTGAQPAEPTRDAMDDELEALLNQGRAEWDADSGTGDASDPAEAASEPSEIDPDATPSGDTSDPRHGVTGAKDAKNTDDRSDSGAERNATGHDGDGDGDEQGSSDRER